MLLLLLPAIFVSHTFASDVLKESLPNLRLSQNDLVQSSLAHFLPTKTVKFNVTAYIDKEENILRVPNITLIDDHDKKKALKKAPKRSTIQKIIRKHKTKKKKSPVVTQPSQTKEQYEQYDIYAKEEMQQKINVSIPQSNQKRQKKVWSKLSRYPMPFQKLNREGFKNKGFRRNKRSDQNLLILKDLDEVKFLKSNNKDYDVVNVHLQKHW